MKKTLIGIGLSVAMVTLASRGAEASALLRLSAAGTTVTCDTSLGTVNAIGGNCAAVEGFTVGGGGTTISFTGSVDGWDVGAVTGVGVTSNIPGNAVLARVAENAGNVTHTSGTSDLTIDFGETNFTQPGGPNLLLSSALTGNWDSSTNSDFSNLLGWGRATNDTIVPGGTAVTALQTVTSDGTLSNAKSAQSPDVNFLRAGTPFALTGRQVIHQAALANNNASFTATITATQNIVPEPASMLLLGTGLLGLARRASRKNRKQDQAI